MTSVLKQRGFTIIEVLFVIAISSLLFLIVLLGQGQIRQRAQFTDAIEQLHSQLERIKNEATTTVSTNPGSNPCSGAVGAAPTGQNDDCISFGRMIEFNPDGTPTQYRVYTLIADRNDHLSNPRIVSSLTQTFDFKWGIEINPDILAGGSPVIAFVRNPKTGFLETYYFDSLITSTSASAYNPLNRAEHILEFVSPYGFGARLIIDGNSNAIDRQFD